MVLYMMHYARKVKKDKSKSVMKNITIYSIGKDSDVDISNI